MDNEQLTTMMIGVKEDIAEIKTGINSILGNCTKEHDEIKVLRQRITAVEKWQDQIMGAYKFLIFLLGLGLMGFIWAAIQFIQTIGK